MLRARIPRVILAVVAGYELRGLAAAIVHAVGLIAGARSSSPLWLAAAVAVALGAVLFQVGRGLNRVASTPRWTLRLIGLWLMFSSALLVLFSVAGTVTGHDLASHVLGADGPWANASAVLGLALLVSVSLEGGGWLSRHSRHGLHGATASVCAPARDPVGGRRVTPERPPAPPPLLAGWSDRGPPSRLLPQTI